MLSRRRCSTPCWAATSPGRADDAFAASVAVLSCSCFGSLVLLGSYRIVADLSGWV